MIHAQSKFASFCIVKINFDYSIELATHCIQGILLVIILIRIFSQCGILSLEAGTIESRRET